MCRRTVLGILALSVILMSSAGAASERPFLSPLFGDNMVLQRGIRAPIWGWTTPGALVNVRIAGRSARAVADADGKWLARIDGNICVV